ncbi:thioredoxin domain-containing protein [Flagellimonas aequoris]|uniref:Thioredoxin domain-containing protein n=1 Tax=Flagellimonas aequoris TaxID=2306997 RepID=A0A418NCQ8_9FLAO|nr:thioredoxin domain-containing protein [Allomuricauda aequoris]RIV73833.1 thioredoxin domain-containing protein [Allomuricauda aequoris]TXK07519.1 thioredoxin domain-containing protein [Allomuricauda aequoris]
MSLKFPFFLLILMVALGCNPKSNKVTHEYTNSLIHETSPYLLQHAHNPVDWEAWHPEVLERAKKQDKLLLISIGYAACHWCHVMEKECFENPEVAKVMNEHFINIKIDREERPDVDQIYMDAIQMISGNGGWPLNIVALPDGRPFWGATYVPKENWMRSLEQLAQLYKKDKPRITQYATDLGNGLHAINLVEHNKESDLFNLEQLDASVHNWSLYFDTFLGGHKRAPKFMMPNNWEFLLHYATTRNRKDIMEFVDTTLTRMAYGGIFDHVGGGFSRYAVDTKWHVPHFEKMLYDNGQLISLYAKAYAVTKNELYKKVVEQTIAFTQEELLDENGGFYSSLDADSLDKTGELKEGAYYVWTKEELERLLGDDLDIFQDYFNINSYGLWEDGNYVLIRDKTDGELAQKHGISISELQKKMKADLAILKKERSKRPKPRLDDKILTSWNALMLKGLVDAYRYLGNDEYLSLALKNASFIQREMVKKDHSLYRNHKEGKSTINAFLEDYATLIDAYISLYEVTFDEQWLSNAKRLTNYAHQHFFDADSGMYFFTSDEDHSLIRRSIETNDNVISSSNSIMANNLFKMDKLYHGGGYGAIATQMLKNVQQDFDKRAQGFANWLNLVLYLNQDFYEIALVGPDFKTMGQTIGAIYIPNSILAGSVSESSLELLQNREVPGKTLAYVCIEGACKLPVSTTKDVLERIKLP